MYQKSEEPKRILEDALASVIRTILFVQACIPKLISKKIAVSELEVGGNSVSIAAGAMTVLALFTTPVGWVATLTIGGTALGTQLISKLSAWGVMKHAKETAMAEINKARDQMELNLNRLAEVELALKTATELSTRSGFRFASKTVLGSHSAPIYVPTAVTTQSVEETRIFSELLAANLAKIHIPATTVGTNVAKFASENAARIAAENAAKIAAANAARIVAENTAKAGSMNAAKIAAANAAIIAAENAAKVAEAAAAAAKATAANAANVANVAKVGAEIAAEGVSWAGKFTRYTVGAAGLAGLGILLDAYDSYTILRDKKKPTDLGRHLEIAVLPQFYKAMHTIGNKLKNEYGSELWKNLSY
jgi:hypothetical protein